VLITIRRTGFTRCSGQTGTFMMIVEQFGFAMIPRCAAMSCGLTSGITSGTSGSMRKAEVLSTTTHPASTARGANFFEMLPPADASTRSTSPKLLSVSSSTTSSSPAKGIFLPADRPLARSFRLFIGKFRC